MKKIYRDKYEANLDNRGEPSKFFIEVPRDCYQRKDEFTKTDILVYSAILAGLNNQMSDIFSYPNTVIAERLRIDERQVRRSVSNLRNNDWITVFRRKGNGRSIRVKCDLRLGCQTGKKNIIRVFDRIFSYPLITKPMVHVYSYYLSLSGMERYKNGCDVSCETVGKSLGYSKKRIVQVLDEMAKIGLIEIQRKERRLKCVKLLVDFSKEQPEEIQYKKEEKRRKVEIAMEYNKNRNNEANNSEMIEEDYTDEQIADMMRGSGFVVVLENGRIVSAYRPDEKDENWGVDGDIVSEKYHERLEKEAEERKAWEDDNDDDMPF